MISEFLDFNKILWYKGRDLSVDYVKLQESVKRETGENPVRCRRCKREKAKLFHCIITASGRSVGRDKKGMLREVRRPAYFFFAATVHGLCKKQRHFMSACSKTDALSYGDSVFFMRKNANLSGPIIFRRKRLKMYNKKITTMLLAAFLTAGMTTSTAFAAETEYEPVTITLNLQRSGLGENVEYTFKEKPSAAVASGDQMADFFFDLGLEDQMAGYTKGSCWSTLSKFPAREKVAQIMEPGESLSKLSKEKLLETGCDFLMGWDSVFSDKNFNKDFCDENGIAMYFPYVCSDSATFEDLYKDYETLGQIFKVEDVAEEKIQTMKDKLQEVKDTIGEEAYAEPKKVFVYDSGEDAPFTACQGMPGDILKLAGGISIFDDIEEGWATPSWEEVIERDPEVILILSYTGEDDIAKKKEFLETSEFTKDLTAVKEGKIYSASCCDMQGSAGSAVTVEQIAQQLYPEAFK